MGDDVEVHITPETPGRPSIRNPFESPNDYHHLREPLVPSPSVFKSKTCKATPPKFTWSIEEMASLFPVHIDQEEIQRQSFYLSQTRTDSDIEQKCQNAIDHFFTKGSIVPSPWAAPESRKVGPFCKKSTSVSPLIAENLGKISVGCQTTLSLPLAFDLEKILGEYYRYEETCDTVQESLSSSSLRRKLFLDGQGSGSDSSTPPSPVRGLSEQSRLQAEGIDSATENLHIPERETVSSIFSSPLSCGIPTATPSTGQFSSSPIQNGRFRDCSLGSMNSPVLPDRSSPARLASPIISPIFAQASCTPIATKNKLPSSLTPLNVPLDGDVTSCIVSPFVEGCSPIRSCSPHHLNYHELKNYSRSKLRNRVGFWTSPPPISPILNPRLQDGQELEDLQPLPSMDLDPVSLQTLGFKDTEAIKEENLKPLTMEEVERKDIGGRLEDEEQESEVQGVRLTSSRMGNVSAGEGSQMFMSLLTEGSSIRYETSMQVDSGYTTTTTTGSLIDGLGSECNGKESFTSNVSIDAIQVTRHTKPKMFYPYH
ncbi:protein aurora borealis [Periophthalmus magnuspinnatus]|uniref:protein aurora borealis n=1 Tax=Periophthalmus magnuspinnatus TaxID=409849 RepID=UPI00145B04AF|nr:protein aurora borealis [Periophthalmus magnuspinnatus]